jgi:hypothetical protein
MNVVLWILQVLLAAAFLAHGLLLLNPPPDIAVQMNAELPRAFWIFLGVAEVLAAVGLTVPGILRIKPRLIAAAAWGVIIVMVAATLWHLVRAEWTSSVITFILLVMAVVVARMRGGSRQIPERGA